MICYIVYDSLYAKIRKNKFVNKGTRSFFLMPYTSRRWRHLYLIDTVFKLFWGLQIKRAHFVEGRHSHVIKYHIIKTVIQVKGTAIYLLGCMFFIFLSSREGGIMSTNNFKGRNGKMSRLITDFSCQTKIWFLFRVKNKFWVGWKNKANQKVKWSVPKGTVQMYRMYLEM